MKKSFPRRWAFLAMLAVTLAAFAARVWSLGDASLWFDEGLSVAFAGRPLPDLDPLLDHLDEHTLAVELAGAFLRAYPSVTPSDYLAELGRPTDPTAAVADRTRYERTVAHALGSLWARLDAPTRPTNTVAANAKILAEYISGVKQVTGAQQVDLVAHSLGGLIW